MRERRFKRSTLTQDLSEDIVLSICDETRELLERRYSTLAVDFDSIEKTNFNPFLLLITAPVYNIFSPFEVAERLQLGKAYHGDDTAFGRFGEEKLLPLFGASACPEKGRRTEWEPVDCQIVVEAQRYILSIKSGPWTMNQTHANSMAEKFPAVHDETGDPIILGIMYGKYENLNNKPAFVESHLGNPDWFDYLVGRDFWEFISGVEDVHRQIFGAIRQAQMEFARAHSEMTFHESLVSNRLKIAQSLRTAFDVVEEEDFWETLFNNAF